METETKKKLDAADLAQFSGSEQWFKHWTVKGIKERRLECERLPEAATARLIAQAGALAAIDARRETAAADEELKRLRRMAGLVD